jgi:TnpA family transposase
VKVSAGGRVVVEETLLTRFDLQVRIPAAFVAGDESTITIETDRTNVPAEGIRRSLDRRRLGLRVFECDVRPIS